MTQCLLHQDHDGFIVKDIARVIKQSVLTMAGKRIKGDVRDDAKMGKGGFNGSDGSLRQTFWIEGLMGVEALLAGGDHRKQGDGRNTQISSDSALLEQEVKAQSFNTRHRGNGFPDVVAFGDKKGVDKVRGGHVRLAHQSSTKGVSAHPSWALSHGTKGGGIRHGGVFLVWLERSLFEAQGL